MRKFMFIWASQAFSLFGSAVVNFALVWYLTRETGSATVLASALMIAMIPSIILGPLVGPLIDRWNRKKIMIYADLATMLLTVILVILFYTRNIQIWHIYMILIGRSIGAVFQGPALLASIPLIVSEKQLVRANGLYQTLQNSIQVVAPPTGAFLMNALSMPAVLSIDIVTAILAVACLLPLKISQLPVLPSVKRNYFKEMAEGWRYIQTRRGLVMLIGLVAVLMFFAAPAGSLIPVLVMKHLEGDILRLGWLTSASGIGGILGGLFLTAWGGFRKSIWTALLGFTVMIPCSVVIGFTSPSLFYSTVGAMLLMGIGLSLANAPLTAIINSVVDKNIQGRVFTLYGSVVGTVIPLGMLISGPVADWLDIRSLYWIAAGAWIIIIPLALTSRSLMDLENHPAS